MELFPEDTDNTLSAASSPDLNPLVFFTIKSEWKISLNINWDNYVLRYKHISFENIGEGRDSEIPQECPPSKRNWRV